MTMPTEGSQDRCAVVDSGDQRPRADEAFVESHRRKILHHTRRLLEARGKVRLTKCREEAGHVLGHCPDSPELDTQPTCRGIKEVEAESIAFIVSASLGIDTSTYSFPYIGHWMTGVGELTAVQATAERVITIARCILDHLDT